MPVIINQLEVVVNAPAADEAGSSDAPVAQPVMPSPASLQDLEERRLLYRARVAAH